MSSNSSPTHDYITNSNEIQWVAKGDLPGKRRISVGGEEWKRVMRKKNQGFVIYVKE